MLVSDVRAQLRDICVKVTCAILHFNVSPVCIFRFVPKLVLLCVRSQEGENVVLFSVSLE